MAAKDSFTLARAETLARKIARFWRNQGYNVRVWAEPLAPGPKFSRKDFGADDQFYQVRSDLVNGRPREAAQLMNIAA